MRNFDKYDESFTVKVVDQPEQVKALLEVGFEWYDKKTT